MDRPRVAVAASGGRDSTALLHCTTRVAAGLGVGVLALHVHHGLSPHADVWAAQVRRQSRRWGAGFALRRLDGRPEAGESVEAWARRERYRALAEMARQAGCTLVLLAHHRRDQAETWLLQALRGGGAEGLAAMPRQAQRGGVSWARPWLELPREQIEAYLRRHRLRWVDDGSNADPRFARNRLRTQVWPALLQSFPDAESALAGAATQAQRAAALAAEAAALDLPPLRDGNALGLAPWLAMPPARRRNALRAWLQAELGQGPPTSLLDRLLDELPRARAARWPAPGGELRLYRGRLSATPGSAPAVEPPAAQALDLSRPGEVALARWQGRFAVHPALEGGVAPELLRALVARDRSGGERFRLAPRAAARSLKKQFQARGVPAWERSGPLLFSPEGRLIFVPGLGLEASAQAAPGEPQLLVTWVPGLPDRTGPRQHGG